MSAGTLVLSGVSAILVASAYLFVARRVATVRRESTPEGRALLGFAVWWAATAVNVLLAGALYLAAAWGVTELTVQLTYTHLQRLLLSVSLTGLLGYFAYLFSGREHWRTIAALYAAFFVLQIYMMWAMTPVGVSVTRWRTDLVYDATSPPAFTLLLLSGTLLPVVGGAAALLLMSARLADAAARIRVRVLSVALLVWWAVAFAAGDPGSFDRDAIQLTNRIVGPLAAFTILFVYRPPGWARRRWGLAPPGEAPGARGL